MSYSSLSRHFSDVKHLSVSGVGNLIGGKVKINVDSKTFENACALRLSYALNKSGYTIRETDGAVSFGADGKWYLYRVSDIIKYVKKIAIETIDDRYNFNKKKGIIVFGDCNWTNATGHVDLFNGTVVEGDDYPSCGIVTLYVLL